MAQFVVFWSLQCLLIVSSLTLSKANVVAEQEPAIVPEVVSGAINEVNEDLVQLVGMDVGVADGVDGDVNVGVVGGQVMTNEVDSVANQQRAYHPAAVTKPRIIEQYDRRSLDGQYEYRYVLSNGETRYERAYWVPAGKNVILARKGYYSHLLKNHKYLTVFYTADQNGFREDSSSYSQSQPTLPRSLKVPEYAPPTPIYAPVTQRPSRPHVHTTTTTRRPHVHATANPSIQWYPSKVPQTSWQHSNSASSNQGQSSHVHHQSSSGVPSSWGTQHLVGANAIAGQPSVPSQAWHSSGVYSSPSDIYTQSGVHTHSSHSIPKGVSSGSIVESFSDPQSPSKVHTPWVVHASSAVQSSPAVQTLSSAHTPSEVQTSSGVHTSSIAHAASSTQSPTAAHTSVVADSPSTAHHTNVRPSTSHSQHHHPSVHVSAGHSTASAHSPSKVHIIPTTIHFPHIIHHPTTHKPRAHTPTAMQPITTSTSPPVHSWHYSF